MIAHELMNRPAKRRQCDRHRCAVGRPHRKSGRHQHGHAHIVRQRAAAETPGRSGNGLINSMFAQRESQAHATEKSPSTGSAMRLKICAAASPEPV